LIEGWGIVRAALRQVLIFVFHRRCNNGSVSAKFDLDSRTFLAQRVLVVDDLVDSALTLAQLFKLEGHDVRVAHNGKDALIIAERFRPVMILTDITMPILDGFELARRVRAQDWGSKVVICAITGCDRNDHFLRSREVGIDHHLIKPFDFEKLLPLIPNSSITTASQTPGQ
jgi:DNA-binding response OmpR family regulator